jgi:hypothetical protein
MGGVGEAARRRARRMHARLRSLGRTAPRQAGGKGSWGARGARPRTRNRARSRTWAQGGRGGTASQSARCKTKNAKRERTMLLRLPCLGWEERTDECRTSKAEGVRRHRAPTRIRGRVPRVRSSCDSLLVSEGQPCLRSTEPRTPNAQRRSPTPEPRTLNPRGRRRRMSNVEGRG